jgi:SAM-dependent methyltransferase
MKNKLKNIYKKVVSAYLKEKNFIIPSSYQSSFVHFGGGYDVTGIIDKIIGDYQKNVKILIIGVFGCRDYFYLKYKKYSNITTVDLTNQKYIHVDIVDNIEKLENFEIEYDFVIMFEVLEHLKFDTKALNNIRNNLSPNGKLILSIPFYNDDEESHIRIYSDLSAKRLFNVCGFTVDQQFYRPGIWWFKFVNYVIHIFNIFYFMIFGHHIYDFIKPKLIKLEIYLSKLIFLNKIRRFSKFYGCIYSLNKSDHFDYIKLNSSMYYY